MTPTFAFTPNIQANIETEIQSRLTAIESQNNVRFLFAIESGSRAWGFPSPDSDYDVRFVYAHAEDWYLSLTQGRDVIETPVDATWDINGWDIRKAINLLLKPNPVLLEWLTSPIRYRLDERACSALIEFAHAHIKPIDCIPHYYHLAKKQWDRDLQGYDEVNLKKYFYTLRPVFEIRWIRKNPDLLPPMNFQALMQHADVEAQTAHDILHLLELKSNASEIGLGQRLPRIDKLILEEFAWVEGQEIIPRRLAEDTFQAANALFRTLIR